MSDLLIKGIKIPKTCSECQSTLGLFCDECPLFKDFPKEFTGESELLGHTRLSNCPLVEIPSHGDLIDRDKLMDALGREFHDKAPSSTDVLLRLGFAPTVIESEG